MFRRSFHTTIRLHSRNKDHHYNILGIHRNAEKKTIRSQYYRLSKKYHPDLNPNNPEAHKAFLEINEAYAVLGNEASRRQYDESMDYQTPVNVRNVRQNGPSASWHARARQPRNTGSASARAQAEQSESKHFNQQSHFTHHYESEERRRQERIHQSMNRRKAAGIDEEPTITTKSRTESVWARIWRLSIVLGAIWYAHKAWKDKQVKDKKH